MRAHGKRAVVALTLLISSPALADLVITEINYAPADATHAPRADLEFVEVYNDGSEPFDLSGYRLSRGVSFEFAPGTFLGAQSYIVVASNVSTLKTYYGISNAVGNFSGVLDNAGETVELSNPQGAIVSSVSYNDRGRWPAGAKETGHSLSIRTPYSDPEDPDNWLLSAQMGGTPGADNFGGQTTFQDTTLVDIGTTWRYFKGTQEPSAPTSAWRQQGFSDGSWLTGATGIGYGDGDDATVLSDMQNAGGNPGYLTIFCRKTFTVADVNAVESLVLSISYDDGFYAYLNGTQVASRNVSSQAFDAVAGAAVEPTQEDIDISAFKSSLVNGTNTLAVQVHNTTLGSSDLSFIPKLVSRRVIEPTQTETVPIVINEGYCRNGGSGTRFVELYNTSNASVSVAGYHLSDEFANLGKFTIANGTSIPARGRLAFTEAQTGLNFAFQATTRERISIALTNPAGTRVVDAVAFEPKVNGRGEARVPDGDRILQPAATPTQGTANVSPANSNVVINEIMYHPISGLDVDEWLELHNRGASAVDLSSWKIDGVGLTLPAGTTISAGAYLVLARDPTRIRTVYGLSSAIVLGSSWTGSLKDGGERLDLVDADGNTVDTVAYRDGGKWPVWSDGGGSSLELIDPMSDNSVAGSWDASDDSDKAVAQTISYGPVPFGGGESDFGILLAESGITIIDDIVITKVGNATNIVNNGTFDSNTTPWRIEGTHIRSGRTTDASERITGAGSLKLICWNGGGDYKVNRVEEDTAAQSSGNYNVSFKAKWVVGSPRIITIGDYNVGSPANSGLAGSNAVAVPTQLGTPGARSSVTARQIANTGSDNVGPAIDRVSHSPGVPEASEGVTATARVRDPDNVSSVRLFYRTDTPVGAFTQVSMADPDGDGVYTVAIPGQALSTRVLFYVEATDGAGAVSRFPTDITERTHPPLVNPASLAPNDFLYCMYRHDTRVVATNHHSYRFVLNQPNQDYLVGRKIHANEMIDGTFIFSTGDVYYNAQVRFAGSPWLRQSGSFDNSYSIKMPKDNPLHERKKALNLDERGSAGSERISHYLLRQSAGLTTLPYTDTHTLVRFQLNSAKDATFEALDKPNGQYISLWFPGADQGAFYEMDDRFSFNDNGDRTGNADGRVQYPPYGTTGGANKENYRWFFSPRSNESADDFLPLLDFCNVMDESVTNNATFDDLIWQIADVEEILRVWAIEMNIDDWDTWGGRRGKNCYLYQSSADARFRLVPWDLELTYGDVNGFALPATAASTYTSFFSEIQRMINRPRIKRLYYGILAEQVNATTGFFHSGFLTPYMQQLASAGVGGTNVGTAGGFIDSRASNLRTAIRGSIYPQIRLAITTNGGSAFVSATPAVDLAGDAPADIFFFSVLRNGQLLTPGPAFDFSLATMTGWTLSDIPLAPGVNTIEVLGLSSKGEVVDSDSIQITSSVSWNAPVITQVSPSSAVGGQSTTITGTDFHSGLKVFFGAVEATSVTFNEVADPTHIAVIVPAGAVVGVSAVKVRNADAKESNSASFTVLPPAPQFVRGDANLDGALDIADAVKILVYLFAGVPVGCEDALDADDSGALNVTDATVILNYLFKSGAAPAAPFPTKGADPTADGVGCIQGGP